MSNFKFPLASPWYNFRINGGMKFFIICLVFSLKAFPAKKYIGRLKDALAT